MYKRLMRTVALRYSLSIQSRILRQYLLTAFGGMDPLEGGSLSLYVFDLKNGSRRLFRRKDLTELYRLLLLECNRFAMAAGDLFVPSEASYELIGPLEKYILLRPLDIQCATTVFAPCMTVVELCNRNLAVFNDLMELFEVLEELSTEAEKSSLAMSYSRVPETTEAD